MDSFNLPFRPSLTAGAPDLPQYEVRPSPALEIIETVMPKTLTPQPTSSFSSEPRSLKSAALEENRLRDIENPGWHEQEIKRGRALEAAALAEATNEPKRTAQSRFDTPSTTLADYVNGATLDELLAMLERERHDVYYCWSLSIDEVWAYVINHDFHRTNEASGGYTPGREALKGKSGRGKKLKSNEDGVQVIQPDRVHMMTREQLVTFPNSKVYLTLKLKAKIRSGVVN
jgi:hypothetical protein